MQLEEGKTLNIPNVGWAPPNAVWDSYNPEGAYRMSAMCSTIELVGPDILQVVSEFVDDEGRGRSPVPKIARSKISLSAMFPIPVQNCTGLMQSVLEVGFSDEN